MCFKFAMPDNFVPRNRFLAFVWDLLTKLFLVSWPLVLAYNVWIVQQIHIHDVKLSRIEQGLTQAASAEQQERDIQRLRIVAEIDAKYAAQWLTVATKLEQIQTMVIRLEERQRLVTHESSKSP